MFLLLCSNLPRYSPEYIGRAPIGGHPRCRRWAQHGPIFPQSGREPAAKKHNISVAFTEKQTIYFQWHTDEVIGWLGGWLIWVVSARFMSVDAGWENADPRWYAIITIRWKGGDEWSIYWYIRSFLCLAIVYRNITHELAIPSPVSHCSPSLLPTVSHHSIM